MMRAIFFKEFLKLKYRLPFLILPVVAVLSYEFMSFHHAYFAVEPESMHWYRYSDLGFAPHAFMFPLTLFIALSVALFEYIPERVNGRVKISLHLPVSHLKMLSYHLISGIVILSIIYFLFFLTLILFLDYFPSFIVLDMGISYLYYALFSFVVYLGVSAIILEKRRESIAYKVLFLSALFLVAKERVGLEDFIPLLFLLVLFFFMAYDSFLHHKKTSLSLKYLLLTALGLLFFFYSLFRFITQNEKPFIDYYLFYSQDAGQFVYQKNEKGHRFSYGYVKGESFDQKTYESLLPFTYYRNLEEVVVKGTKWDKKSIREAKLSFSYKKEKKERKTLNIFPLFTTQTGNKSILKFPEKVYRLSQGTLSIYDAETKRLDQEKTHTLNALLKENIAYPIQNMWGKKTNLKPYDWGYVLYDANDVLWNLKYVDNRFSLQKMQTVHEIVFLQVVENREKRIFGYALDKKGKLFIIDTAFRFHHIALPGFTPEDSFQFLSDPMNDLIRYRYDGNYCAILLSKTFQVEKSTCLTK